MASYAAFAFEATCQSLGGNMSPECLFVHWQQACQVADADRHLAGKMSGEGSWKGCRH